MVESRCDLAFAQEPLGTKGRSNLGLQELDGDLPAVLEVAGERVIDKSRRASESSTRKAQSCPIISPESEPASGTSDTSPERRGASPLSGFPFFSAFGTIGIKLDEGRSARSSRRSSCS